MRWYLREHRPMPWRTTPGKLAHPYKTLVSEMMLQQTRVAVVKLYYRRWIKRFPTIRSLARAKENDVLALWQGLGYYRRARLLHKAAKVIVDEYRGRVPRDVQSLRNLPGVGAYTAGAIASMSFGEPAPVVDGNVRRVLARWMGKRGDVDESSVWDVMREMVKVRKEAKYGPGDVNQAVMELGATVCLPRNPKCTVCPLRSICAAYESGCPQDFGYATPKPIPTDVIHRVVAISDSRRRWIFEQREDQGMWSRMWQAPTLEQCHGSITRWIQSQFGISISKPKKIGSFKHLTTHRRIHVELSCCR